uniref:KIAA0319-like n=1 Tax=Kryptolebias marmoratus TaxID=37003 RepID=A0A3Q3GPP3_KRYMA
SAGLCRVTGGVLGIHWSSTVGLGWYPLASGRGGATCWESCCLKPSCGAAWSLGGRCVLLSCSRSGGCPIASLPQPHEESLGLLQLLSKRELVVSAGEGVEVTLPRSEVELNAYVVPPPPPSSYTFDWRLITHPKDYSGEMEGKKSRTLKLSKLTVGLYEFGVTVDGEGAHGEGYVNVTVKPPRVNKPPVVVVSPKFQEISLPTSSTVIDGSGPDGVKIENADGAVAVVTGLEVGSYKFTLTVTDERNLQSSDTVKVIVREQPPVARVLSSPPVSLPVRTAVLDGSHSTDDKGGVSFLWTRDDSSPAAGDVLNNSDHQAVLFLGNLVEGKYMFTLTVTDSKGQSSSDRGAVEVRALWERDLVELLMEVPVSQVSQRQRDMLLRQVGVLLGVLDSDIIVREISAFNERTRLVFLVSGGPDRPPLSGRSVALSLRNKLRKQKNDFLIFKARRVDTVCQMNCSGHGECDPFTRSCVCHPFWMENFIRAQLGDAESNCWSVLYVTIASFMMVVSVATVVWLTVCCCNSKARRSKSRYKMLEADERDGLELQLPRARLKPVPPPTSSALMHSDSEFDSDEGQERGHLLRPQNGSLRNGQGPPRALKPREEHL